VAELVRHFTVTDVRRGPVNYASDVWQKRGLVLIALPPESSPDEARFLARVAALDDSFTAADAASIVTRDSVAGLPPYGVLIADRWGEIAFTRFSTSLTALPGADDLLEWIEYVQRQCPECQGEVR
jgi:hypothetical protein